MTIALVRQVSAALAAFSSSTRLYELSTLDPSLGSGVLLVEAFAASEALQEVGWRDVIVLSTSAYLDPAALLGQPAALDISLADGNCSRFGGEIVEAAIARPHLVVKVCSCPGRPMDKWAVFYRARP